MTEKLTTTINVNEKDIRVMRVNDDDNYKYLLNELQTDIPDFIELIRASTYVNYKDEVKTTH